MEKSGSYEYKREMKKEQQDCKRRIIKNAISIGIGIALVFGAKQLKSEEIITSQNKTSIYSKQVKNLASKEVKTNNFCDYLERNFYSKIDGNELYSCLFESDSKKVYSALFALCYEEYTENDDLKNKISSRIIEIIENPYENEQIFSIALKLAQKRNLSAVIPILTKSFNNYNDFMKHSVIETFGYFALNGNIDSANALFNIMKSTDCDRRSSAALAYLMFVDKNLEKKIHNDFLNKLMFYYTFQDRKIRCEIFLRMHTILRTNAERFSDKDKQTISKRLKLLKSEEIFEHIHKCIKDLEEDI